MKEKQASQQAKELARLQAEEQAKIENARRMQELCQQEKQKAAEQTRLKKEATERKERAAQPVAEDKKRNEKQSRARREARQRQWQSTLEKWNKRVRSRSFWVPGVLGGLLLSAIPLSMAVAPGIIRNLSDRSATRSAVALTCVAGLITPTSSLTAIPASTVTPTNIPTSTRIAAPSLFSPANGSTADSARPVFQWNKPDGANKYIIQISKNADFSETVVKTTAKISIYQPPKNLPQGTLYWRVLGKGANGPSDWSIPWSVIIP